MCTDPIISKNHYNTKAVAHKCSGGGWQQTSNDILAAGHEITHGHHYKGKYIIVYTVSCTFNEQLQPVQTLQSNNTVHELKCGLTTVEMCFCSRCEQTLLFTFIVFHTQLFHGSVSQSLVTCNRLPLSTSCVLESKQDPEIWAKGVRVFHYISEVSHDFIYWSVCPAK